MKTKIEKASHLRRTAFHEAGRYLVATTLSVPVSYAELSMSHKGITGYMVSEIETNKDAAVVGWAGIVADILDRGQIRTEAEFKAYAIKCLKVLPDCKDLAEELIGVEDKDIPLKAWDDILRHDEKNGCFTTALTTLLKHRSELDTCAFMLMENGHVDCYHKEDNKYVYNVNMRGYKPSDAWRSYWAENRQRRAILKEAREQWPNRLWSIDYTNFRETVMGLVPETETSPETSTEAS